MRSLYNSAKNLATALALTSTTLFSPLSAEQISDRLCLTDLSLEVELYGDYTPPHNYISTDFAKLDPKGYNPTIESYIQKLRENNEPLIFPELQFRKKRVPYDATPLHERVLNGISRTTTSILELTIIKIKGLFR